MRSGKLTNDELQDNVLALLKHIRPEVVLSAALGEDCAALALDGTILMTSDPITAAMPIAEMGALCVDVCCNDVSANGGLPLAMTMTLIMPESCDTSDVKVIMDGAARRAEQLGVEIVGGHTEFSDCVVRPIVSGTAIGRARRLLPKTEIRAGDTLLVTKKLALEGTCIVAAGTKEQFPEAEKTKLARFSAMLSVVRESEILSGLPAVHAMHDITEGGVLGAVAEICKSVGLGAELYESDMPLDPLTVRLCKREGLDPLRLLSSGSMLVASSDPVQVIAKLEEAGIECRKIGKVTEGKRSVLIRSDGSREETDVTPDAICGWKAGEK